MTQEKKDKALDSFRRWTYNGLLAGNLFFISAFFLKVDKIGDKVDHIDLRLTTVEQKTSDMQEWMKNVNDNITKILFKQQLSAGAADDKTLNQFGTCFNNP